MKQSKLSILENKYYYAISRYFWHIVIALSIMSIAASIAVYLYSLIPATEEEVVKPPKPKKQIYPKMKDVNLQDILDVLPKKKTIIINTDKPTIEIIEETNYEEEVVGIDSLALAKLNQEIGNTKDLLPESIYPSVWHAKYRYYFSSSRNERMYRKTKNPELRLKELISSGFKQRFIRYTNNEGLTDYNDKTDLLKATNTILENLNQKNRKEFLSDYVLRLPIKKVGSNILKNRLKTIAPILSQVDSTKQLSLYRTLWRFVKNNPNDGLNLVNYEYSILNKVAKQSKIKFIKTIQEQYSLKYNNKLDALKETTNNFLPYLDKIDYELQAEALTIFYRLYTKNNKDRSKTIQQIENQYTNSVEQWESNYQQALNRANINYNRKVSKKNELKEWSYKGILSGFGSVLFISLILLILSMIRNVNRLSEAMYNNTKTFQDEIRNIIDNQKKERVGIEKTDKKTY